MNLSGRQIYIPVYDKWATIINQVTAKVKILYNTCTCTLLSKSPIYKRLNKVDFYTWHSDWVLFIPYISPLFKWLNSLRVTNLEKLFYMLPQKMTLQTLLFNNESEIGCMLFIYLFSHTITKHIMSTFL